MTDEELQRDFLAYLRGLQREPHTIFVGFSVRTEIDQAFRDEYVRRTVEGNPGRTVTVLEMGSLGPDEMMIAEPDDEDIPLAIQRVVPPKNDEPREDDGAVARDAGGEGAGR